MLIKSISDEKFAIENNLPLEELKAKVLNWKSQLYDLRNKREKPRLDDKSLTSWNALMLKAYVDAYRVFNENVFLIAAIKNAKFIIGKQLKSDGGLYHTFKEDKSSIFQILSSFRRI